MFAIRKTMKTRRNVNVAFMSLLDQTTGRLMTLCRLLPSPINVPILICCLFLLLYMYIMVYSIIGRMAPTASCKAKIVDTKREQTKLGPQFTAQCENPGLKLKSCSPKSARTLKKKGTNQARIVSIIVNGLVQRT